MKLSILTYLYISMSNEKQIFTLKQVADSIQRTIQDRYSRLYWVQAEMHKLNYTNKGHCYPELVQKEDGKTVAEMRGTIWKFQYDKISKSFMQAVKEPLRDGLNLLFLVKISFHTMYGMGLEIVDIDPTFALGELQKEREETLKRLTKEGILNSNQQLKLAMLPQRIAIISVESSKGLSDFYKVINSNPWKYKFFFHLFPAQLNGDMAIPSIQSQLNKIRKVVRHFDAVAIIRGGGGEIGLSCYNNYQLSKAIATFPLPVFTGIGHSTNITVSEMVAYRSAITPTELGEFLLQAFHDFSVPVQEAQKIIKSEALALIRENQQSLGNEIRIFKNVSKQQLQRTNQLLINNSKELLSQIKYAFSDEKTELTGFSERLKSGFRSLKLIENQKIKQHREALRKLSTGYLFQERTNIDDNKYFIHQQVPKYFIRKMENLVQLETQVRWMDPQQILKKGYSISMYQGKAISAKNPVEIGAEIEIWTSEKKITSIVKNVKDKENE